MAEEHNIPKTYDPASVEKKWYQFWEKNKYFHAEPDSDRKPFTIVIPPPNITGQLDSCTWGMPWTTRCRIS